MARSEDHSFNGTVIVDSNPRYPSGKKVSGQIRPTVDAIDTTARKFAEKSGELKKQERKIPLLPQRAPYSSYDTNSNALARIFHTQSERPGVNPAKLLV